jgi:hypothetical protein
LPRGCIRPGLIYVDPRRVTTRRRSVAIEHITIERCTIGKTQVGHSDCIEIHATVVDALDLDIRIGVGLENTVHDVRIASLLDGRKKGSVEFQGAINVGKKQPEQFKPAAWYMWKEGFGMLETAVANP